MKNLLVIALFSINYNLLYSQGCCSGGSGSPIAGGAASGVLLKNQMEVSASYQYVKSHLFKTNNNRDTTSILNDTISSDYLFLRTDYGITEKLTMSLGLGYFIDKSLVNKNESYSSYGISDLIIFPRYNIFNWKRDNHRTEITLGLGVKFPLGSHTDSSLILSSPLFGDVYAFNPPTVQLTTGSTDAMFYSFFYRTYPKRKFRVFANTLYIKKSFNSQDLKFGDYVSVSLFAGKSLPKNFGITGQLKYEHIGEIGVAEGVNLIDYNIEEASTGSNKIMFVPQISYSKNSFTYFATADIPLYEDLNGSQIAIQNQFTLGVIYRFMLKEQDIGGVLK